MYVLARDNQFLIAANLLAILNPISMWVAAVSANLSTKQLRFQSAAQRDQTCLIYLSPSLSHTLQGDLRISIALCYDQLLTHTLMFIIKVTNK